MNPILSPYVLIMIAAGAICTGIAVSVWRERRTNSETIPLVLLLLGISEWIAATLAGILDPILPHKMLWAQIEYIGVVSVPLMVLVYVLHHFGSHRQLTAGRLAWLALIPAATLILAWTNGNHGWIWAHYMPHLENGLTISEKTYGPGFWVYWVYSYLLLLTATVITIRAMIPTVKIFRRQNVLILIGILAPWIGNFLSVLRLAPLRNLDLTPLAFSVTGTMLALGMFRWRLFDIKPVAQTAVIAGMADGVMILDTQDRIVDVNSAAQSILGSDAQALVGKPAGEVIASRLPAGEQPLSGEAEAAEIRIVCGEECRIIELSSSPFREKRGAPGGKILFLRDLTERKRLEARLRDAELKHAEDLLRQSENKYETLFQNMTVGVLYQVPDGGVIEMNPAAERILGVERTQISDLASSRVRLKAIHEDGSAFPPEEHPGMIALKTGRPLRNRMMGIYFPGEKNYRWINIHAVPQIKAGEATPCQAFVTFDDVTERKRAEDALLETERRLASIYDTVGDVIFLLAVEPDGQYRFISVNAAFGKVTGIASEQVVGRTVSEIIPETSLGMVLGNYRRAIAEKRVVRWEETSDYPTGRLIGEVSVAPVHDEAGNCTHLVGSVHDITERKRAEEALRESEEKFKYVFDNSVVGKSITLPGGEVQPNRAFCELLGYSPDELQHKRWQDLTHPDDIAPTQREIDLLLAGKKEGTRFTKRYLHKNGSVVWADISTSLRRNESGNPKYFMTTLIDITERKRIEDKLRAQASLLKSVNDAIIVSDAEYRLADWNAAAEELYGWKAEEVIGRNGVEILRTEWPAAEAEEMRRMIQEQGHWRGEAIQLRKDGTRIPVEVSSMVLHDAAGRVAGYISLNRNISERKQAEEKIALLAKFPSQNPNPVLRLAHDGTVLYANEASQPLLDGWGISVGKPAPGDWRGIAAEALEKGTRTIVERQIGDRTYSFLIAPIAESDYVNLYGRDETERKRAEEALLQSRENFTRAFISSPAALAITRLEDGKFLSVNEAYSQIMGYAFDEIIGRTTSELDIYVDARERDRLVRQLRESERVRDFELKVHTKSGSINILNVSMEKIVYDKQACILSTFLDITGRKQMEKTLRESEEKYRLIADNADDWVYLTAPDRSIPFSSPSCERVTGYTVGEFVNNPELLAAIVHPDDRKDFDLHRLEAQGESQTAVLEFRILTKSGETRWINHSCVPVCNDEGQFAGRRGTNRDITERRRAEEALQKTLADLERSNTELEQFAYVASHDLQEPLRMISSFTQLLGQRYKGQLDSDADEFIGYAVDGATHMQRLINDLLAYSRVGTRGRPPAPVPADLALDRALDNLKLALEEARAGVERGILPTVTADDVQLTQVFQNLIANAIKFHRDEPPRIAVACEERGAEWIFSVHDNGIGIDPQHLERIFIIFQRLNPRGLYPGTGIGLAICRKIIQRHGGRIWAESEPGKGSTFFFSLPRTGG